MIKRRARRAGLPAEICAHSFFETQITEYLRNGGALEVAARIAGHAATRATQLYDKLPGEISLDEIERIHIRGVARRRGPRVDRGLGRSAGDENPARRLPSAFDFRHRPVRHPRSIGFRYPERSKTVLVTAPCPPHINSWKPSVTGSGPMLDRRGSLAEIITTVGHTVGIPVPSSELEKPKKNASVSDNLTVKLPAAAAWASRPCPPDTTTDARLPHHRSEFDQRQGTNPRVKEFIS